ncbi:MAG TPA: hypothetical protein VK034_00360, partial [Enhygromyxa sp.]|nr:hypothetical protein [Enhygromyxa sp.]
MHRLLVLVLWCFGPPTLPDETSALSLRWQAPSPCMERAQALERVRELVPTLPDPVPEAGGRLAVEVELVESGASDRPEVRAVVRFRGERGLDERRFAGASCESVAAAAVLVVAVTIDPIASAEAVRDRPEVVEPEAAEPKAPESETPESVSIREAIETPDTREPEPPRITNRAADGARVRQPSRVRAAVGALGGAGWGPIRAGMGGLSVDLAVHGPWWRAAL